MGTGKVEKNVVFDYLLQDNVLSAWKKIYVVVQGSQSLYVHEAPRKKKKKKR